MICIDGGVFQNNPTTTALVEVFKYPREYANGESITLDDIFVLSIGTGRHNKFVSTRHAYSGGQIAWIRPIIDISMWGNSQAVDEHMERLFLLQSGKRHYLRLNVDIPDEEYADMAISSKEAMDYYTERFKIDYLNNPDVQAQLDQWLIDSEIVAPLQ
ncbi:patatin-like phospholipase domain-containing protein [Dawidia soli]|uniref:PNPLA domain-containing protein n=1 Tax=Dawidia soli TaxID=2782352 RepID=A0AAP2D8E1_9BACT|nr:hypothetical protein [Dawidia soli]MBT1687159.1 hypothetical protein [Dawidia soli]